MLQALNLGKNFKIRSCPNLTFRSHSQDVRELVQKIISGKAQFEKYNETVSNAKTNKSEARKLAERIFEGSGEKVVESSFDFKKLLERSTTKVIDKFKDSKIIGKSKSSVDYEKFIDKSASNEKELKESKFIEKSDVAEGVDNQKKLHRRKGRKNTRKSHAVEGVDNRKKLRRRKGSENIEKSHASEGVDEEKKLHLRKGADENIPSKQHSDVYKKYVHEAVVADKKAPSGYAQSTARKFKRRIRRNKALASSAKDSGLPDPPTTCCMSGCANCVWLEYAEKLSEYFKDGGETAIQQINEHITDQNIKAFVLHEVRMRQKKKKDS